MWIFLWLIHIHSIALIEFDDDLSDELTNEGIN